MKFGDQIRQVPFVRLLLPLILGIFTGMRSGIGLPAYIPLVAWGFLLIFYFVSRGKPDYRISYVFALPVFLFIFLGGWYLSSFQLSKTKSVNLPEDSILIASITETPKETEKSVAVRIRVEAYRYHNDWYQTTGNAIVYLQKDTVASSLRAGMLISFHPEFDSIRNAGNPGEFDYANYMAYHMIASRTFLKSGSWCLLGDGAGSVKLWFLNLRNRLLNIYRESGLEGDEYAVAAALSLGYKDKLQDGLRHAYSSSGAMHVLAVSGLHVGIIFLVMQFVLGAFRRIKKLIFLQVSILVLSIWFYAMLTGMSPSVTRAAVMFSFISVGKLFRQNVNIYNILAASAFLTLVINPLSLSELGFWLSYLAVLSIVTFFPPVYALITPRSKLLDKLWSLVAVSIAAQIGTAPLTVFYFHQFSNYFILTNVLVIPIVTIIVYLAVLLFAVSFIPGLVLILGRVLAWLINLLNRSVYFVEGLPAAVSENLYISRFQMFILYAAILSFILYFILHKRKAVFPALLFLLLFISTGIIRDMKNQQNEKFIVYNLRGNSGINFILGQENIMFTDFKSPKLEKNKSYLKNHWLAEGIEKEKFVDMNKLNSRYMLTNVMTIDHPGLFQKEGFIGLGDFRILIIRDDRYKYVCNDRRVGLDYIILSCNADISAEKLTKLFDFKCVILDSSNAGYYRSAVKAESEELGFDVYDVSEKGAFVRNL